MENLPDDAERDERPPPGFMDRPEVKRAVEEALRRVGDHRTSTGKTGFQLIQELREQGYLEPRTGE